MTAIDTRRPATIGGVSVLCLLCGTILELSAARAAAPDAPVSKRPLWTTSHVEGLPGPPDPYRLVNAFPKLKFSEPLAVNLVPGTDRFVLAERHGKLFTFVDGPEAEAELLMDVGRTVYGVAADPKFATNGFLYVTSIVKADGKETSRLSRFEVQRGARWTCDLATERQLLQWEAGGHNGGCVKFGPDGYLYLSTGDGSGWADWFLTGQRIDDFLASILRIDVRQSSAEKPYSIPPDNPFINTPKAKPEVYSYGHRNVWKFNFDRAGRLWAGDVGQDLWEMVELVEKGGNYGWSVMEGTHVFDATRVKGPTPILKPIIERPHSESRSITWGNMYEASDLPDLKDAYIYGDYDTGKVWAFHYRDGRIEDHRQLADTQFRIVEFARDHSGRVMVVDFISGTIQKLVPAPPPAPNEPKFPTRLSETGLFASTADHRPAPGLIPYDVNAPLWSDGAFKERFIAVPGDGQIEFDAVKFPTPPPGWRFPHNTVLVKTFSLEMHQGDPATRRRLETRLLHHKRMPGNDDEYGAQFWMGYTYVWNEEQTDAVLLDAAGEDRVFTINGAKAPGGTRKQTWHFPSRSECTLCHTMAAKYALGVNTLQMNRDFDYGDGRPVNQLEQLSKWGLFTQPLPKPAAELPSLAKPSDHAAKLDDRARAYLHANCSHCHRLWGGGLADFSLPADVPLEKTGIINVAATRGDHGITGAKVVVPGDPMHSMLLHRMELIGLGRMPHIASNMLDEEGIALIREWIQAMKP